MWRSPNTNPRGHISTQARLPFRSIRGGNKIKFDENDYFDPDEDDSPSSMIPFLTPALAEKVQQFLKVLYTALRNTPPVTRVYLAASFLCTAFSSVFLGNRFPNILLLDWSAALLKLQLWRPITSFLYLGPFGISFILTIQFLWQYMAQVEKLHYDRPEKFVVLIAFGGLSLLLSYFLLGISTQFLGHNLSTYLVYIWSRMFEGISVNMMGLLNLPAEMLPWFFCAQTMIVDGVFPFADLLGIVIGQMYLYCEKKSLLEPPDSLTDIFASKKIRQEYSRFKTEFE